MNDLKIIKLEKEKEKMYKKLKLYKEKAREKDEKIKKEKAREKDEKIKKEK